MATTLDPRAQRSREALIAAMIAALDTDPTPPSISELVKSAGASRPTFYQHFGDTPTLMRDAALARLETVIGTLPDAPAPQFSSEALNPADAFAAAIRPNLTVVFEHLAQHRGFYKAVVRGPSGVFTIENLVQLLSSRMLSAPAVRSALETHLEAHPRARLSQAPLGEERLTQFAQFVSAGAMAVAVSLLFAGADAMRMVDTTIDLLAAATGGAHAS